MTVDINKLLIRCSSLGDIMTKAKEKDVEIGATCASKLKMIYRQEKWDRQPNFSNRYTEKGVNEEESSITLFSLYKNKFYRKNKERLTNTFITGEYDLDDGQEVIEEIVDIKTSWDWTTFPFAGDKLDKDYYWQMLGYLALTGAKRGIIAYCLVNSTIQSVLDAQKRLAYKLGDFDEQTPEYIAECVKIEKNMIVDQAQFLKDHPHYDFKCSDWTFDIPASERVMEFVVERDEEAIEAIYKKIPLCRQWIANNLVTK